MGRKREKGRRRGKGGRAEEARKVKCTRVISCVPRPPSHSVNFSAADDKVLFPCARQKPGDEAKPKRIPGNKAEKLQEQLVWKDKREEASKWQTRKGFT